MSIKPEDLDWWFKTNKNVMLVGKHGVGKTAMIKSCFERNGLIHNETYLYFSASTLDPWVDLIGCPKEVLDDNGFKYLDIIRPKNLYKGKVVAIFFDEFNRSPKKVRNAVMELLQFKSINGFKFPDLKCVWTAINPEDNDSYDVEKVDPAQQDRFHIIKEIPYACDMDFFVQKFGNENAAAGIEWWNDLPEKERNLVSPRRLEYALDEFVINGNLRDILPASSNVSKLLKSLKNGPVKTKIVSLYDSQNKTEAKLFLSDENNINSSIPHIIEKEEYMGFFLPFLPKEKLVSQMGSERKILDYVLKNHDDKERYYSRILQEILSGPNRQLSSTVSKFFSIKQKNLIQEQNKERQAANKTGKEAEVFYPSHSSPSYSFSLSLYLLEKTDFNTIQSKAEVLKYLKDWFPDKVDITMNEKISKFILNIVENSSINTLLTDEFKVVIPIFNRMIVEYRKAEQTDSLIALKSKFENVAEIHEKIRKQLNRNSTLYSQIIRDDDPIFMLVL